MTESTATKESEGAPASSAPVTNAIDPASDAAPATTTTATTTTATGGAKSEPVVDDRPPLLPLSSAATTDIVTDQSRAKDKENDEKNRRVREGDDRDRQTREIRAGLHPLQVALVCSIPLSTFVEFETLIPSHFFVSLRCWF